MAINIINVMSAVGRSVGQGMYKDTRGHTLGKPLMNLITEGRHSEIP
jgi:hypothetical protein